VGSFFRQSDVAGLEPPAPPSDASSGARARSEAPEPEHRTARLGPRVRGRELENGVPIRAGGHCMGADWMRDAR
jgi:hypothetical protein